MRSCEGTGKNIEQAIQNALLELKAAREDVDIKILSEGGFLKKAKVLVSISEDALEKYEKREKFKEELKKEEAETKTEKTEAKAEEKEEDFAENFIKKANKAKEEKTVKTVVEEPTEKTEDEKPAKVSKKEENLLEPEEFLKGVLDAMGLQAEIEKTEDEKFVYYNLVGENLNELIGHHGECMMSLSYLMTVTCKSENKKRLVLDVENYRKKREESLVALAKRIANKVAKTRRYYKLEPMDASERKIIHTALQDDDRVTTLSKGEEPKRYLIVFPKEYDER